MNRIKDNMKRSAVVVAAAALFTSCAMEVPFGEGGDGDLTIVTEIRGDVKVVTRAMGENELVSLKENCIVYIENSKGVIKKYKGVDNIPQNIRLKTGQYVAEAWSGDSVSASFDKKFYRGYEKFEMAEGSNALTLKCNIANVLVSIDPESLNVNLQDMKVTFSHSRGELVFDSSNIDGETKGYFMMPNADKDLKYVIEGKKPDGSAYKKEGVIAGVQRAHEYSMKITQDQSVITDGGAWVKITIADIPVIEDEVEIFPAPAVNGVDYLIEDQIISTDRDFKDVQVYVRGYFGLNSLVADYSSNFTGLTSGENILSNTVITSLRDKGIIVERNESEDAASSQESGKVKVDEVYITFTKSFLDALPASSDEYSVTFTATDAQGKRGCAVLRLANTEDAIDYRPVAAVPVEGASLGLMAIRPTTATITGQVFDANAANYGIKYRKQGTTDWRSASAETNTRASALKTYTATLTGLDPGTTYEYIAYCDGFDSKEAYTFTTESIFTIPNASFEDWSTYSAKTLLGTKNVTLPWSVGDKEASFWGSGNEGAATANMTLTDKSTDMLHSGTYSARLESKSAMGMLAAGNVFVGTYVRTDGTNGVLSLGREYNGSHPSRLRVWANYRPGSGVSIKSGNESFCPDGFAGGNDHGQIYVALTTEKVEIRTNPSDRKLFNKDEECVLAYGEQTWTSSFGPDGALQQIDIPIVYNDRAKSNKPLYLVIVVSASKYGDYFSGAAGSVMYLDDFELIYE